MKTIYIITFLFYIYKTNKLCFKQNEITKSLSLLNEKIEIKDDFENLKNSSKIIKFLKIQKNEKNIILFGWLKIIKNNKENILLIKSEFNSKIENFINLEYEKENSNLIFEINLSNNKIFKKSYEIFNFYNNWIFLNIKIDKKKKILNLYLLDNNLDFLINDFFPFENPKFFLNDFFLEFFFNKKNLIYNFDYFFENINNPFLLSFLNSEKSKQVFFDRIYFDPLFEQIQFFNNLDFFSFYTFFFRIGNIDNLFDKYFLLSYKKNFKIYLKKKNDYFLSINLFNENIIFDLGKKLENIISLSLSVIEKEEIIQLLLFYNKKIYLSKKIIKSKKIFQQKKLEFFINNNNSILKKFNIIENASEIILSQFSQICEKCKNNGNNILVDNCSQNFIYSKTKNEIIKKKKIEEKKNVFYFKEKIFRILGYVSIYSFYISSIIGFFGICLKSKNKSDLKYDFYYQKYVQSFFIFFYYTYFYFYKIQFSENQKTYFQILYANTIKKFEYGMLVLLKNFNSLKKIENKHIRNLKIINDDKILPYTLLNEGIIIYIEVIFLFLSLFTFLLNLCIKNNKFINYIKNLFIYKLLYSLFILFLIPKVFFSLYNIYNFDKEDFLLLSFFISLLNLLIIIFIFGKTFYEAKRSYKKIIYDDFYFKYGFIISGLNLKRFSRIFLSVEIFHFTAFALNMIIPTKRYKSQIIIGFILCIVYCFFVFIFLTPNKKFFRIEQIILHIFILFTNTFLLFFLDKFQDDIQSKLYQYLSLILVVLITCIIFWNFLVLFFLFFSKLIKLIQNKDKLIYDEILPDEPPIQLLASNSRTSSNTSSLRIIDDNLNVENNKSIQIVEDSSFLKDLSQNDNNDKSKNNVKSELYLEENHPLRFLLNESQKKNVKFFDSKNISKSSVDIFDYDKNGYVILKELLDSNFKNKKNDLKNENKKNELDNTIKKSMNNNYLRVGKNSDQNENKKIKENEILSKEDKKENDLKLKIFPRFNEKIKMNDILSKEDEKIIDLKIKINENNISQSFEKMDNSDIDNKEKNYNLVFKEEKKSLNIKDEKYELLIEKKIIKSDNDNLSVSNLENKLLMKRKIIKIDNDKLLLNNLENKNENSNISHDNEFQKEFNIQEKIVFQNK